MDIQPLDRQIYIVSQILKLLEANKFKYDEWEFAAEILNDAIKTQSVEDRNEDGTIKYHGVL